MCIYWFYLFIKYIYIEMNYVIIEANKLNYSDFDKNITRFKKDNLEEDIEDYVQIFDADDSYEGMQCIIEKCKFDNKDLLHTTIIYESSNCVYYMIHNIDNVTNNINKIAMYLTKNRFNIYGSVGIIKEQIINNNTIISKIKFNDILEIYHNSLVFKGIKISEKNIIDEFTYILNPIDWMKPDDSQNFKFFEYEIFDKILMVFIELYPKNDIFNYNGSVLLQKKTNGTVYVALRTKIDDIKQIENIYENLDKTLMDKLIAILSVNQDEIKENDSEKNNMKIMNFYTILEKRYNNYLNKKNILQKKDYQTTNQKTLNSLAIEHLNKQQV